MPANTGMYRYYYSYSYSEEKEMEKMKISNSNMRHIAKRNLRIAMKHMAVIKDQKFSFFLLSLSDRDKVRVHNLAVLALANTANNDDANYGMVDPCLVRLKSGRADNSGSTKGIGSVFRSENDMQACMSFHVERSDKRVNPAKYTRQVESIRKALHDCKNAGVDPAQAKEIMTEMFMKNFPAKSTTFRGQLENILKAGFEKLDYEVMCDLIAKYISKETYRGEVKIINK